MFKCKIQRQTIGVKNTEVDRGQVTEDFKYLATYYT